MASISELHSSVKEARRQPHRSWQRRKLSAELDSAAEISHQFDSLCAALQQFCRDQATTPQARFLKDRGFPLLAALEHSLRRCRILSEIRDEMAIERLNNYPMKKQTDKSMNENNETDKMQMTRLPYPKVPAGEPLGST